MSKIIAPETLDLKNIQKTPLAKGLLTFAALLIGLVLLAEIIARTPIGYFFPPPSTGADNFVFDSKTYYLEQQIRQKGSPTCLIVGSSVANDGLDPDMIEQAYEQQTGLEIQCFNFGMPALTMDSAGNMTTALKRRYHPKLILYVLTARDFISRQGEFSEQLRNAAWIECDLGAFSTQCWALNNSYSYRYSLTLNYWLVPGNRQKMINEYQLVSHNGFSPLDGRRDDWGDLEKIIWPDFSMPKKRLEEFQQIANLNSSETTIIFVEAPFYPPLLPNYLGSEAEYEEKFINPIQEILAGQGIQFWETRTLSQQIPDPYWWDRLHLNADGVEIFSIWAATQIADQIPMDTLK
ncbi:MAG: hypothetical protein JXA13_03665 [Anaerolineales bacterium]|nr:hypothetical protein [Anaerolineales bacterium]